MVKNLPAKQETQVQSLDQEDPLEKEMATHPSILTWRVPWTEEPGGLQSTGSQKNHNLTIKQQFTGISSHEFSEAVKSIICHLQAGEPEKQVI